MTGAPAPTVGDGSASGAPFGGAFRWCYLPQLQGLHVQGLQVHFGLSWGLVSVMAVPFREVFPSVALYPRGVYDPNHGSPR